MRGPCLSVPWRWSRRFFWSRSLRLQACRPRQQHRHPRSVAHRLARSPTRTPVPSVVRARQELASLLVLVERRLVAPLHRMVSPLRRHRQRTNTMSIPEVPPAGAALTVIHAKIRHKRTRMSFATLFLAAVFALTGAPTATAAPAKSDFRLGPATCTSYGTLDCRCPPGTRLISCVGGTPVCVPGRP